MKQEVILATSHTDRHGDKLTKEALESMADQINSERKIRSGLDHDMSLPPVGRLISAKVIEGDGGEYQLVGVTEYFDKRKELYLRDGSTLIKEIAGEEKYPFKEVKKEYEENINVLTDPNNFNELEEFNQFNEEVKQLDNEIITRPISRKSWVPDPEIVFTLTELYLYYFFGKKLLPKIEDEIAGKIASDVGKLYDKLKQIIIKYAKRAVPSNRPITYIFEFPGEIHIELIIQTKDVNTALKAIKRENVKQISDEIAEYAPALKAEKIQYIFDKEKQKWELNYLLTIEGDIIGKKKSFDRRDAKFLEMHKTKLSQLTNNKKENS